MSDEVYATALTIRREVGAEYVDRALAEAERDVEHLVTEYCWRAVWGRGALTRRDCSLLNLAMLGTLGRNAEFKLHLKGALRSCTKDEIEDTLIHLAIYAGIPAGVEAFRLAKEVFATDESDDSV